MAYQKPDAPGESTPSTSLAQDLVNPDLTHEEGAAAPILLENATLIREGATGIQDVRAATKRISSILGPLTS